MTKDYIAYYTDDRKTLPLDALKYNRSYNKTDIFYALADANDFDELFNRLKGILASDITVKKTTEKFICFSVDGNNLKFKIKKEE
ncbi:MAG: hypothetical protein K6G89_04395 [Clostridia bacterium]|nr:hypothetical protein [Clostridia bacterium]